MLKLSLRDTTYDKRGMHKQSNSGIIDKNLSIILSLLREFVNICNKMSIKWINYKSLQRVKLYY